MQQKVNPKKFKKQNLYLPKPSILPFRKHAGKIVMLFPPKALVEHPCLPTVLYSTSTNPSF